MTEVQAIAFAKKIWTKSEAQKWLSKNKFLQIKPVHETKNMYHFRITEPDSGRYDKFVTKVLHTTKRQKPILLTLGLTHENAKGGVRGNGIEESEKQISNREHLQLDNPRDFQDLGYPLREKGSILDKSIDSIAREEGTVYRDMTNDEIVREQDNLPPSNSIEAYFSQFGPETMIGAMMRPRSQGGPGFPFATSDSVFNPGAQMGYQLFVNGN